MANVPDRLAKALAFASLPSVTYRDRADGKWVGHEAKVRNKSLARARKKLRAELGCEVCGWVEAGWESLHAHHVIPLACGGQDGVDNILVLCPNHHALAHTVGRRSYWKYSGPLSRQQMIDALRAR